MNHASNTTNADLVRAKPRRATHPAFCFEDASGARSLSETIVGVRGTVVGYANGSTENPSYRMSLEHVTPKPYVNLRPARAAHRRAVGRLLFEAINPTSVDRQGTTAAPSTARASITTDEADSPSRLLPRQQQARYTNSHRHRGGAARRTQFPPRSTTRTTSLREPKCYRHIGSLAAPTRSPSAAWDRGRLQLRVAGGSPCEPLALRRAGATAGAVEREDIPAPSVLRRA